MDLAREQQEEKLPIIDFSAYSLQNEERNDDELQRLATRLVQAFSTEGFVYLRNHGIPNTLDVPSFLAMHSLIGTRANITSLTTLHYPPVPEHVSEGQLRCGEHTDYGSITLLFQDTVPGLEVLNRHGRYISAPPLPDTVVVNIGDLMQRNIAWLYRILRNTGELPAALSLSS
ncbi:Hypp9171 [Branchiostoma lanceolatum]|uniref:Hypp9171 protein n=1 Tax=Branchiostoma lanceolatum TaxID=7740 RepID=A0A8K0EK92_BRALA|nr:Hypp9171 [Branchiostoma lanceolatum]